MNFRINIKIISAGILLAFCCTLLSNARDIPVEKVTAAKAALRSGVNSWDGEKIKQAGDMFLNLLMNDKSDSPYLHYYVALCHYRLAAYFMNTGDTESAQHSVGTAQKHLDAVIEREPEWGEPYALKAAVMGFEIALDMSKAMSLGMEIYRYFDMAVDKEPDNPRIHFIRGTADLYTPEQFGGGAGPAIEKLTRAVQLFDKEDIKDPIKPSWGKEEAMTFLGMAYQRQGEPEKAREWYEKALSVNPDFGMAREELDRLNKRPF